MKEINKIKFSVFKIVKDFSYINKCILFSIMSFKLYIRLHIKLVSKLS